MQASDDVGKAIAYYSQCHRISQPVMEACIFKKPYFIGRFLRSLLSPSPSIDSKRENFIAALAKYKILDVCPAVWPTHTPTHPHTQGEEDSTAHAGKL